MFAAAAAGSFKLFHLLSNGSIRDHEKRVVLDQVYIAFKPQNGLFLNGNKFYYSTGNTAIKAFRGYFKFVDVLTSVEDANNVKVDFNIDGNTTLIYGLSTSQDGSAVYTIDGKHMGSDMERLHRGIYIQNGKKVVK